MMNYKFLLIILKIYSNFVLLFCHVKPLLYINLFDVVCSEMVVGNRAAGYESF